MSPKPAKPGPYGTKEVSGLLGGLDHPLAEGLRALRHVIVSSDDRILEGIKWNSASFFYNDWFATFHLRSTDNIQVVLHTGAKGKARAVEGITIDDPDGLLKWLAKDRCLMTIDDVEARGEAVTAIIRQWLTYL